MNLRALSRQFLLLLAILFFLVPLTSEAAPEASSPASQEILVKFKFPAAPPLENLIHRANSATKVGEIPQLRIQRVRIPSSVPLDEILDRYRKEASVEFAEPNYSLSLFTVPNDGSYSLQWAPPKIEAERAWDLETGGSSTVIAVVDSGVDYNHPDLAGKVIQGYDYHNNDADPMDDNGHGTHVAGIAAAVTNNGLGMAGLSWGSPILAIKVADADGLAYLSNVASGITYAADNGAKVINLSLGGPTGSTTMKNAIDYAVARGVTLVAAVGNDGNSTVNYPAAYSGVIGVGATGQTDARSHFSNYNAYVDVVAPGESIYSTYSNSYAYLSGTSMATPHVAGLAALIISEHPTATKDDVESRLESAAVDLGSAGRDNEYGFGRIDAYNAIVATTLRYEESSGRTAYTGTWNVASNVNHSGGSAKYSSTTGNYADFAFTGTFVSWIGNTRPDRGIARVYIDGAYQTNVDLYDPVGQFQRTLYTKGGLTNASHTIRVEVSGTKNSSSVGYIVVVDAFDVI